MSKRLASAFVFSVLLAFPAAALGSALLMPEGEGQLLVTTTFADASDAYDGQGRLIKTPSYKKFETQAYVEYGAISWLTVVAEASGMNFQGSTGQASLAAPNAPHYSGLGLGGLGVRVPIGDFGGSFVSLQAGVRAASSQAAQTFLDMKEREQFDVRLQAFRGFQIADFNAFFDAQFGYRTKGQNGDEARIDLTAGVHLRPDFMVMAQSFTAISLWPSAGNSIAVQKFEISGVYNINPTFSVQLGFVDSPMGINSPAERGIVTSLWTRF